MSEQPKGPSSTELQEAVDAAKQENVVADAMGRQPFAQPQEGVPQDRWPYKDPEKGHIYGFLCPATGHAMAAMTVETWNEISNTIQQLRAKALAAEFEAKNLRQHALSEPHDTKKKGGLIIPNA